MTDNEPTHDGWPAEYRDPRDWPHPETLRITVEPFEQAREETLAAARTTEDGESTPAVASFASIDDLRKVLTERRIELLCLLIAIDGAAECISALASHTQTCLEALTAKHRSFDAEPRSHTSDNLID